MRRILLILRSVSLVLLAGFTFISCDHKQITTTSIREYAVPIEIPVHEHSICKPDRGEEQDIILQSKGHAFDSMESTCL